MSSSREIRVPREIVNDDFVTIVDWQAATGARVRFNEVIVLIETSKAVMELEAEVEGYLEVLHPEGAEVGIGEVIGFIHLEPIDPKSESIQAPATPIIDTEPRISKKARVLIEQYGINPSVFSGQGLVREADVIHYLEERSESVQITNPSKQECEGEGTQEKDAVKSIPIDTPKSRQGLWQDIKISAGERGRGVIWLFFNYIWKNWLLGNLVRWTPRIGILSLHRLRGVKIGRGCFIDSAAIIETAFPENITIGDDVRITAGVIIMTHIKPPHYLRETGIMPSLVRPVVLEDHCFIGINAVIMPGVTIGKAAVVASGAVVVNTVPPYTMVAGSPAKIIKRFPRPERDS